MINDEKINEICRTQDNTEGAYLGLQKLIERIGSVNEEEWNQLVANSSCLTFKKKELLLQANQQSGHFWFVFQGLVRNFYITEEGKDFNKSFIAAPSFCGSMTEIITGQASRFSIEALEDTTVIAISINWFKEASHKNSGFQTLALVIAEQLALKKEQREAELLLDDATTRYQRFVIENSHLAGRIAAYHIASYLGITEVALSRIKRSLKS
jgi:CRP-like cAMP-binding protein